MTTQTQKVYYPTTAISDGQHGEGFVAGDIRPIREDFTLFGKAITVKLPIGENGAVLEAIAQAERGDVLVVDARGDLNRAIAGDFVMSMMKAVGIAGLVVDGVIRDIEAARALDFPVFCKGTTAVAGVKNGGGRVQVPVAIGEVAVQPGDYIFGDADGVIVVPQSNIDEVLERTQAKIQSDTEREASVLQTEETVRAYLAKVTSK